MARYRHEECGGNWVEVAGQATEAPTLKCIRCGTVRKIKVIEGEIVPLEKPIDRVRALIAAQKERGGGLVSITALEQAIGDSE